MISESRQLPTGLWAQFKVYPDRSKDKRHFIVFIFKSKRSMIAFDRSLSSKIEGSTIDSRDSDFLAKCKSWQHLDSAGKELPDIGAVLFFKSRCRIGIISHEFGHATINYMLDCGVNLEALDGEKAGSMETNERFCWVLGNMVRQFVLQYNRELDRQGAK